MPNFESSAEWYEQSSLLLKARPTTARVTSKYTVLKPTPSKIEKRQKSAEKLAAKRKENPTSSTSEAPRAAPNPEEPVATFKLKTYDPVSGTCLKYETNKAAEVGRLIGSLGRLGRHMAALPEVSQDPSLSAPMEGISTPTVETDLKLDTAPTADQKAGGGGGKKKKKGKK